MTFDEISTLLSFYSGTEQCAAYLDSQYHQMPCNLLDATTANATSGANAHAGLNVNAEAEAGALSNKARKRAARKARRAAAKAAAVQAARSAAEHLSEQQQRNLHERQLQERGLSGLMGHAAGKSGRAREARLGCQSQSQSQSHVLPGRATHRARGGAPVAVDAAHSFMLSDIDVASIGCDWWWSNIHKW